MKTLINKISNMGDGAKAAVSVTILTAGMCLAPLLIPNECKNPLRNKGKCYPAGWNQDYNLDPYQEGQKTNVDYPNNEF